MHGCVQLIGPNLWCEVWIFIQSYDDADANDSQSVTRCVIHPYLVKSGSEMYSKWYKRVRICVKSFISKYISEVFIMCPCVTPSVIFLTVKDDNCKYLDIKEGSEFEPTRALLWEVCMFSQCLHGFSCFPASSHTLKTRPLVWMWVWIACLSLCASPVIDWRPVRDVLLFPMQAGISFSSLKNKLLDG